MASVILFVMKQAFKILAGVVLTVAVFFGVGWFVDWKATKNVRIPDDPKFWQYTDRMLHQENRVFPRTPPVDVRAMSDAVSEQRKQRPVPQISCPPAASPQQTQKAQMSSSQHTERHDGQASEKENELGESALPTLQHYSQPGVLTYTIQLGSFQNAAVAKAFLESLTTKGYPAYMLQTDVEGKGTVYRIRIGKFSTMEEAQTMARELEKKESISAFITSK
ncbi:MAG: SPOR domain-containing protein [Desulfobacterota bacterium]|nr:SPOR domain-containing protein [Thermodesulfobacteriota bacterium]